MTNSLFKLKLKLKTLIYINIYFNYLHAKSFQFFFQPLGKVDPKLGEGDLPFYRYKRSVRNFNLATSTSTTATLELRLRNFNLATSTTATLELSNFNFNLATTATLELSLRKLLVPLHKKKLK
jgi:hypothetical protein